MTRMLIVVALIPVFAGCAQMRVTKITADQRASGCDSDVKGMRYYLSRPYVCVKRPILVSTSSEFYIARADGTGSRTPIADPAAAIKQSRATRNRATQALQAAPSSFAEVAGAASPNMLADGGPSDTTAKKATEADAVTGSTIVSEVSSDIGVAGRPLKPQLPPESSGEDEPDAPVQSLGDDIEIVYLPDLDEQYAVHGRNCFSKQAYGLRFEGGWKLTGVNVEEDATPVPIEFLNLINKAIQAARNLEVARIDPTATIPPLTGLSEIAGPVQDAATNEQYVVYEAVRETYIKPGVYRLNKPWEMQGDVETGSGLLGQLGLPLVERSYQRVARAGASLSTVLGDLDLSGTASEK